MRENFDTVVRSLIEIIEVRQRSLRKSSAKETPILFLLGAGCSMQYGLPGYRDLLYILLTEKLTKNKGIKKSLKLQELQEKTDSRWRLHRDHHLEWLRQCLGGIDGQSCLAYRRLARCLKRKWIDGVVNLNFDPLFSQACVAEGLVISPAHQFPNNIVAPLLVEPHGGLGKGSVRPMLDLRATDDRKFDPGNILATSHVVVVGYGGGDDPILKALKPDGFPADKFGKLFFFNIDVPTELKPRERLIAALDLRNQHDDYAPIEASSSFENLMEAVELGLSKGNKKTSVKLKQSTIDPAYERLTRSEAVALTNCRRLAGRLRLAASVAESSPVVLEEHAREMADLVFGLARSTNLRLLPVERVLIQTISLFHDLGYFWGASHEKYGRYQGWKVLRMHGAMAVRMLQGWWREDPALRVGMVPAAYNLNDNDLDRYSELVLWLCSHHNSVMNSTVEANMTVTLRIDGVDTPVRKALLQALLSAAEQIALEHPFQPSLDPVVFDGVALGTIDDPVLDLFLVRRRGLSLEPKFEPNLVTGNVADVWTKKVVARFFVSRIASSFKVLSGLSLKFGGGEIQFRSNVRHGGLAKSGILGFEGVSSCLEEALADRVTSVPVDRIDAHVALLDLLAIYCISDRFERGNEPRVQLDSPAVKLAIDRIAIADPLVQRKSLIREFVRSSQGRQDVIDEEFAECFTERIYPAWRFVGRKWHDGVEATTTALTTLEMGSSRFRSEVIVGLRRLLSNKVNWGGDYLGWHGHHAQAHDGCILCCSRLIIAFSYARLLFEEEELEDLFIDFSGSTLLDALAGLLRYFLSLRHDDARWFGEQVKEGRAGVRSADYLAFAASAVGFFLATEEMVKARSGAPLDLGRRHRRGVRPSPKRVSIPDKTAEALLRERWDALSLMTRDDFLSREVEEPHSLVLGRVALVLLSRDYFPPKIAKIAAFATQNQTDKLTTELFEAWEVLEVRGLSHLGRLNLWPVILLLDRLRPSADLVDKNIERYRECMESPIWVGRGGDAGSWGFNVRTTAVVCSALNAFWRHVLFVHGNRVRYSEIRDRVGQG